MTEEKRAGYPRLDMARQLFAVCDFTLGINELDKDGRRAFGQCKKA